MEWKLWIFIMMTTKLVLGFNSLLAPTDVKFVSDTVTSNSLWISWEAVAKAESYTVVIKPPTIGVSGVGSGLSDTFASVKGLRADTEYKFTIYAVKGDLTGIPAVVVQRTALPPPESVSVVEDTVSQDSMTVQWSEVANVQSYTVEVQPNTGVIGAGRGIYATQATLRGMSSNTLYTITVTGVNWVGKGAGAKVTQYTKLVPPMNLRVIVNTVTSTSMAIYWDEVVGSSKYVIRVSPHDTSQDIPSTVSDTDLVLRNLQPDVSYKIEVAARNRAGDSLYNSVMHRTLSECHALARDFQEDRFTLNCPADCLSDEYSVYGTHQYTTDSNICAAAIHDGRLKNAIGGSAVVVKKPGLTFFVGTPDNGVISNNYGSYDRSFVFGLQMPGNLHVIEDTIEHHSFTIEWESVNGAESYRVETIPSTAVARGLSKVTDTKVQLTGLKSNTTYLVYVTAANDLEISESSSIYQSTTLRAPSNVNILTGSVNYDMFELIWLPLMGAASYSVQVTSPNGTIVVNDQTPQNNYKVTGLLGGTLYNISLRAIGKHGPGQAVKLSQYTDLKQPGNLLAKYISSDSMEISWEDVHGATTYQLAVDVCCEPSSFDPITVYKNKRFLENLTPNTIYQFVIVAVNENRKSIEAFFTQRTALPAIQDLHVMNETLSDKSVVISWNPMPEADTYSVHIFTKAGFTQTLSLSNLHKSYKLTGLTQNTNYFVTIFSINDVGVGENTTISFKTMISAPSNIIASFNHREHVYLIWGSIVGATDYMVNFEPKRSIDDYGIKRNINKTIVEGMKMGVTYNITIQAMVGMEIGLPKSISYMIPKPTLSLMAVFSIDPYTLGVTWKSDLTIAWVSYNTTGYAPLSIQINKDNTGYVTLSDLDYNSDYTIQLYTDQLPGFPNEPIFGAEASTNLRVEDNYYDAVLAWGPTEKMTNYEVNIQPNSNNVAGIGQQNKQTLLTYLENSKPYLLYVEADNAQENMTIVSIPISRTQLLENGNVEAPTMYVNYEGTEKTTSKVPDWPNISDEEEDLGVGGGNVGVEAEKQGEGGQMWIVAVIIGGVLLLLLLCVVVPCCCTCGRNKPLMKNHGCCFCCGCCHKSKNYNKSSYIEDTDDSD